MPRTFRIKHAVAIVCRATHARLGLTSDVDPQSRYDISLDYSVAETGVARDSHVAHLEWVDVPAELTSKVQQVLSSSLEPLEGIDAEPVNEQDADHSTQVLAVAALRVYEQFAFSALEAEQEVVKAIEADEAATEQTEPQAEISVVPDPATVAPEPEPQATTPPATEPSTEPSPEVSTETPAQ